MTESIQEFHDELIGLRKGFIRFSKSGGEQIEGQMEAREPLLFAIISETMEDATGLDITTTEGIARIRNIRLKEKRFEKWYTQKNK